MRLNPARLTDEIQRMSERWKGAAATCERAADLERDPLTRAILRERAITYTSLRRELLIACALAGLNI